MATAEEWDRETVAASPVPADFRAFWDETLRAARAVDLAPERRPEPALSDERVAIERITFHSLGGARITAWLCRPRGGAWGRVVHLPGYSAGWLNSVSVGLCRQLAAAGLEILSVEPRGQGASREAHPPEPTGKLLTGIERATTHIYRGIVTDCVRAAEYLAEGTECIGVIGNSQGGGLALMVAALLPERIGAVCAMEPFLTHYEHALAHPPEAGPYRELLAYLAAHPGALAHVRAVMAYFDTLHHAPHIEAPALLALGARDATCAPATVRRLFARLRCKRSLLVFPELGHANHPEFYVHMLNWLRLHLRPSRRSLDALGL